PADDRRRSRHAAGGKRAVAQRRVRPFGETRLRLRARLARRRSPAVGQSLLVTRAHRFSLERAPADAANHGQGRGAAVLSAATHPPTATKDRFLGAALVRSLLIFIACRKPSLWRRRRSRRGYARGRNLRQCRGSPP